MPKPKVETASRLVFEAWTPTKKGARRLVARGRRVWIDQAANGDLMLRIERLRRWRYSIWDKPGEVGYHEGVTSTTKINLEDGDVDAIFDALVMVKDILNRGVTLKSTMPPEEKQP